MKRMYIIIIMGLALLSPVFTPCGYTQVWSDSYGAFTYNMGLPMGETKDFTGAYSWRGIGLEFRKFYTPEITLGLSFGWNVFHEESYGTYEILAGSGHVTGNSDRTINAFPIMAGIQYNLGDKKGMRPYIGLNVGGYFMVQRMDIGVYSFQEEGWNWGLAPEIGLIAPLQNEASLLVNIRYNYAFEMDSRGPFSYLGINLGFAWSTF